MTESKSMDGILINNIPFTHPCHVPQILGFLRQQALFNSVVASCIRPCSKQDLESMIMFEVSALSWQHLSISLEHPLEESMATAELDLSDISNVNCKVYTPTSSSIVNLNQPGTDSTSELASKILHRCLSIPITMRCVIKLWDEQANRNGNENFSLPLGAVEPGGHNGNTGNPLTDFGGLDGKIKQEHGSGTNGNGHGLTGTSLAHPHQSMFLSDSMISASGFPSFPGADASMNMLNSIEIGSLLSGSSGSGSGGSTPGGEKPSKRSQKRKASDELWKNPKRKSGEDNEMMMETSSSDSTSMGTPTSHDAVSDVGMATPNSALGFHSDLELSGLDAPELINAEKAASEYDSREAEDLGDVEEMLAASATSRSEQHKARKLREERKSSTSSLLLDLAENKNLVPPSVSITPITTTSQSGFNQVLTNMGLERRPGIEIIPIASTPATSLPSSITITPISSSHAKPSNEERRSDKKSSKNRSDDKSRLEKKRKRKRDEEAMGPPDKLPPKQDPLSKPVSVSIKPAESPPLPGMTPTSPSSMLRKYSSSPTHQGRTIPLSGKSSPSMLKPMSKSSSSSSSSSHHSPKHSPAHVISSPKHASLPGMSSPKNHGTSPKHPSASSSGKPSMSTLKSAANSPSSKSGDSVKVKLSSKDSSTRDKEKKLSSNVFSVNNPKVKTSSIKLKQVDLSANVDLQSTFQSSEGLPSPSGTMDLSKSAALNQVRNRKGSLSAVIDKLKSAQHCGAEGEVPPPSSGGNSSGGGGTSSSGNGKSGNRDGRNSSSSGKVTDQKTTSKVGETKNSEYMVKPSSDGMKITINKTRTKESSKSNVAKSTSSGTGSPKTHTGLKPGVNSGPASKKPQQVNQKASSNAGNPSGSSASSYSGSTKGGSGGSSSGKVSSSSSGVGSGKISSSSSTSSLGLSKSVSKLTGSPKTGSSGASDLSSSRSSKDGRPRVNKSSSDKSIFSSSKTEARRASPTSSRDETDNERPFKLLTQHSKVDSALMPALMEGMIKTLDKNFQIPKLSNRTGDDKKSTSNKLPTSYSDSAINNIPRTVDVNKMYDMIAAKSDISLSKYPLSLTSNNLKNNLVSISSTSPLNTNPLSFSTSSSSPKLNMVSPSHIKDLTIEPAINMSSSELAPSNAGSEDSKSISKPKDLTTNSAASGKDEMASNCKLTFPISAPKNFPGPAPSEIAKPSEGSLKEDKKPAHPATSSQEAAEMLLDFSSNLMGKPAVPDHIVAKPISLVAVHRTSPLPLGPPPSYPASPSVSVHIVKSPAPSPLVNPSPHSVSPCITDDELMDEALVGLGK